VKLGLTLNVNITSHKQQVVHSTTCFPRSSKLSKISYRIPIMYQIISSVQRTNSSNVLLIEIGGVMLKVPHGSKVWLERNKNYVIDDNNTWTYDWERRNYHIRAYLSSIQHKNLTPYRFVADSSQMISSK
jgi:hypothetical protein